MNYVQGGLYAAQPEARPEKSFGFSLSQNVQNWPKLKCGAAGLRVAS